MKKTLKYTLLLTHIILFINNMYAQDDIKPPKWHIYINTRFIYNQDYGVPVSINGQAENMPFRDNDSFFANLAGQISYSITPFWRVGIEYAPVYEIEGFATIEHPDYFFTKQRSQILNLLNELDITLLGKKNQRHLDVNFGLGILLAQNKLTEMVGNTGFAQQPYENSSTSYGVGAQARVGFRFFINKNQSFGGTQHLEVLTPTQSNGFDAVTSEGAPVKIGNYTFPFWFRSSMLSWGYHF